MRTTLFATLLAGLATADGLEDRPLNIPIDDYVPTDYPKADINSLYASTGNAKKTNKNAFRTIAEASQSANLTPTRSIDSLFLRLPSSTELDELILSADSVAILKTIQTVATDDSIPCAQRIAYLLELLGRIRCAVEKKQFAAEQLRVIIDGANAEIARLQKEIEDLREQITDLWLDELKDKLADLIAKLEDAYKQFNQVEFQIAPKEAEVAGFERQIEILQRTADSERNRISNDRLRLVEAQAKIRDLEIQLSNYRARKASLEESIKRSEEAIAQAERDIEEARQKIRQLEKQIRDLRDQLDAIRLEVNTLQIQVERLRTDISVAEAKKDQWQAQIDELTDRIEIERRKLADDELKDLQDMIEILKKLIPTTEAEIDRHYYNCYGDGVVEVQQTGSVLVYIVRGERVNAYIHQSYGPDVPDCQQHDLNLKPVSIFDALWTSKFGYPFPNTSFKGYSFQIQGSFSCLDTAATVTGYGKIVEVGADYIKCDDEKGHTLNFRLGACSRIESTHDIPEVGQGFYYRAAHSSSHEYNLYAATCV